MFCLENGRFTVEQPETLAQREDLTVYRCGPAAGIRQGDGVSALLPGEGFLAFSPGFYVEPEEILVDYLKSDDEEQWLKHLMVRHITKLHGVEKDLFVLTEMGRTETESDMQEAGNEL